MITGIGNKSKELKYLAEFKKKLLQVCLLLDKKVSILKLDRRRITSFKMFTANF